ncbi:hypothetical protein SESBI_45797 [Sesbania bispinosa]|nr:hypothetical protein SESBI_45797 [Sesbania bispinosa]
MHAHSSRTNPSRPASCHTAALSAYYTRSQLVKALLPTSVQSHTINVPVLCSHPDRWYRKHNPCATFFLPQGSFCTIRSFPTYQDAILPVHRKHNPHAKP